HRRLQPLDDILDRLGDPRDRDQRGDEGEHDGYRARDRLLDEFGGLLHLATGDRRHRRKDRTGQSHDLLETLEKGLDHVVDRQRDLDARADRVGKPREPGHGAHHQRLDHPVANAVDNRGLEAFDRLDNALPDADEALLEKDFHHFDRLLEKGDLSFAVLAQALDQDRPEIGVSEADDLQRDREYALEIELLGELDVHALKRAEEPAHQSGLEVLPDVAGKAPEAADDRTDQVLGEAEWIAEDQRDGVARLLNHAPDPLAPGSREHQRA